MQLLDCYSYNYSLIACKYMRLPILIITQNVVEFIAADMYEQEPISGEFLGTHLKNSQAHTQRF